MKYLSLFSGIGTAEKGIEQAYERQNQYQDLRKSGRQASSIYGHGESVVISQSDERQSAVSIGFAEIDKYAASIYKYHWPDVRNYGDATGIVCEELPDFDFLVAGFPCQSFSIAGKRQGFNEARGTLFFEIARILSHKRPRHFLLENVKGLLSSDDGKVYTTILRILSDLGYRVETVVLNSKHFGVPQNRERVFFIGHFGDGCSGEVLSFGDGDGEFDEVQRASGSEWQRLSVDTESRERDQSGIESGRDGCKRHGDTSVTVGTWRTHKDGQGFREVADGNCPTLPARAREDGSGQAVIAIPVLTPDRPTKRQDGRRFKENGDDAFTLTSQDKHGVMVAANAMEVANCLTPDAYLTRGERDRDDNGKAVLTSMANRRIRRLTEVECERLQGLPDGFTQYGINDKGETVEISSTQRYKCLGNAMTVDVIEAIVTRMLDKGCLA